jgi:ketosteroid isomerase-like protein
VSQVVESYLAAVVSHDWDGLRNCLREDVVRVGPFRDEYRGRDDYVAFLSELMPSLPGYSMDVARVTYTDDHHLAFAELAETVTVDGSPLRTEESLVFELDGDGERITHIDIYIKTHAPALEKT